MSDSDDLRMRIAQACRVLGRLDLAQGLTGHVSARIPGTNRILIRARGPGELGVRYTEEEQILEVDLDGKATADNDLGLEVPLEVFIHTSVYKARPDVNSVVHVHPPTVVLFTICDVPILPIYGAYDPASAQLALDDIPRFDSSVLIDTPELGGQLVQTMGEAKTCLMRGHGITTAGPSIEEASLYAIDLNELAQMNYQARLLGTPRPISESDQERLRRMNRRQPGGARGDKPAGRAAAVWRYYCELTES